MTVMSRDIETPWIEALRDKYKGRSPTDKEMTEDAFTVLNWAFSEAAKGRAILSAEPDGTKVEKLAHPPLIETEQWAAQQKASQNPAP